MSRKSDDTLATIAAILVFIILFPIFASLSAWFFMFLWNSIVVWVFPALPILDFWRSLGCVVFLGFIGNFFKK